MNAIRICAAVALYLLSAGTSHGVVPESGLWWNPAEGGRGYGIELQDDLVFVTYYAYQPDGTLSAFYTTLGTLDPDTGIVEGYWAAARNGQCFGCAYRAPELTELGQARLQFFTPSTGRLTLPGNLQIPIERQLFVHELPRDDMYGTWHLTSGALGVYFGEFLWIREPDDALEGGFIGQRIESTRILVGAPHPSEPGVMAILVDSSTSYYTLYLFEWSFNRWGGNSWTYLKTDEPSGPGLTFFGSRLLGRNLSDNALRTTADASGKSHAAVGATAITDEAKARLGGGDDPERIKLESAEMTIGGVREVARELALRVAQQHD